MTQYTLHKDQKKVYAIDHGYAPMHSPENFFWYMKQGMQTLCCGGCWDWGIVCGLCVVVVQSLSLLPHSTVLHKIGSKQSRGRLSFYTKTFLLAHGLQTSPKQIILAKTLCTRVRFSCTVIHVALLFTGLKSVHYSTFLDFKCFSQMNLFKLNKVSFRNQCYCYNRLVL